MTGWAIREEAPGDADAIAELIYAAFRDAAHTDGTEGAIPGRLRQSGQLSLSLVAEFERRLVGQVTFSPVAISERPSGWYGLGPVAVIPECQGAGIGSALIGEGISRLRHMGAAGCVVLGEPGYYDRFGFRHDPALAFPGPPPEYFMKLALVGPEAAGEVRYAAAFY